MHKFNYRIVLSSIGILLMIEAFFMLLSAFVGVHYKESAVQGIYFSSIITVVSGGVLMFLGRKKRTVSSRITKREVYLTVTSAWVMMTLFGTLPFLLSDAIPSFSDAFFETMCGFTTTGSSTLINIEAFPKSLHFWRSFTQWIGGIGIIIFVMSFMPVFGGSSGQFFDAESTGITEDLMRPRINVITTHMALTYIGLTIVGFLFLWAGPMNSFDAACHTFSAISTGGFSTKQASIAYFNSPYTEYVITALMFFGGTNFMLLFTFFSRHNLQTFRNEEFRWYIIIILIFTLGISAMLLTSGKLNNVEYTIRTALFQVVSAVTSTGYATVDYLSWGEIYWLLFLAMILFCGCEGSTSGGMKLSRLVVLAKNTLLVFKKQVHPDALYRVKINGKVISENTSSKIYAFVFLYLILAAFSAVILSFTGMTFNESIGVSVSSISSYGFGLGSYGPSGTFESASVFAKYYLCFLMLVGRLEVFTVLSLFVPSFWKR
jgi:trk system potassium uptake protein TrkH